MMKFSQILSAAAGVVALVAMSGCAPTSGVRLGSDPNPVAYRPKNQANVRIKVSLAKQQVYVMEGSKPLLVAATCVGLPNKPTPKKNDFKVTRRENFKRSNSYGFWKKGADIRPGEAGKPPGSGYSYVGYPMQYWVEFKPTYGFHCGYVWPVPRSHGCLRLHKNVAGKFYELAKEGTPISIADHQPEDATIGANVPRPNDFNDPDPAPHFMVSPDVFQRPSGSLLVDY